MNSRKLMAKRVEKGLTIQDMANILGISKNAYWFKEKGRTSFKREELKKVIKTLNLSKDDFIEIFFDDLLSEFSRTA